MAEKKKNVLPGTFQARLAPGGSGKEFLAAWAAEFSRIQRCLFRELYPGKPGGLSHAKPAFMKAHGIQSRHYNAMKRDLDGKVRSYLSNLDNHIIGRELRIKKAEDEIAVFVRKIRRLSEKTDPVLRARLSITRKALFQKRRRLARLEHRLNVLKQIRASGRPSICFGSRTLFRRQFNLVANGIACHKDWKIRWRRARRSQFFAVGSKDETAGNLCCQLSAAADGTFSLNITVPDCLVERFGTHVEIRNVTFKHGHEFVAAAVADNELRRLRKGEYNVEKRRLTRMGETPRQTEAQALEHYGTALSYRFVRKKGKWYVMLSADVPGADIVTDEKSGMLGVDVNADHLAVTEVNRYGAPVTFWTVPLHLHGKTTGQRKALILGQVKRLVDHAQTTKKPICIEILNFRHKKQRLFSENKTAALKLSSFACSLVLTGIKTRCHKSGVACVEVNPAYTSLLGKIKYQKRYGMSGHHAAAFVIARKGMGFSDLIKSRKYHHFFEGIFHTRELPEDALAGSLSGVLKKVGKHYRGAYSKLCRQSRDALDPARAGPTHVAQIATPSGLPAVGEELCSNEQVWKGSN